MSNSSVSLTEVYGTLHRCKGGIIGYISDDTLGSRVKVFKFILDQFMLSTV